MAIHNKGIGDRVGAAQAAPIQSSAVSILSRVMIFASSAAAAACQQDAALSP